MKKVYDKWLQEPSMDDDLKRELKGMNDSDIEEAFYKELSFGTGGMRGIIGAGTNRMNRFTVQKAVKSFGLYLLALDKKSKKQGVAIAHDNRYKSEAFAKVCVEVLSAMGIKSYLYDALRPTPALSHAVRALQAAGGIMITASHNPPKYNGIKMYDETGCQLVPDKAEALIKLFNEINDPFNIERMPFEVCLKKKRVTMVGKALDDVYLNKVNSIQLNPDVPKTLKIVFTPLHGASRDLGLRILTENGYDVYPVKSQMTIDPEFSTVKSPNPEDEKAFEKAIAVGKQVDADLLIATDPDGDRLGLMVKHGGSYQFLTGNQTGAIFIEYLLSSLKTQGKLPEKGKIFNTIVSSEMAKTMAEAYGMEAESTLTGFKFIGEKMQALENSDTHFLMGYEESYGYVIKDFVRDKDAIQSVLFAAEIANVLKQQHMSLIDYLNDMYETYGHYRDIVINKVHEGKQGAAIIQTIMDNFRAASFDEVIGLKRLVKEDYLNQTRETNGKTETLDLPQSNVLKFMYEEDMWFVLRPSGTEPKLKIYLNVVGKTSEEANNRLTALRTFIDETLNALEKE